MKGIIKFGIMFLLASVVFSLLGSSFTLLFDNFNSTLTYISTGSIGMVLFELVGYIGWLLDFIFLSGGGESYTLITAPNITVGSVSWVLTLFRLFLGCLVFILILSLVFGKGGSE